MPTINVAGNRLTFTHPRELAHTLPRGPRQPLSEWPGDLAHVEELAAAGDMSKVFGYVQGNHFRIRVNDLPEGARTAAKLYAKEWLSPVSYAGLDDDASEAGGGPWRA